MTWDAPAVVLVIGAIGLMVVNIIQAWRASDRADQKADKIIQQGTEIHALANNQLSIAQAALKVEQAKSAGLEAVIALLTEAKRDAAAVLAIAAAAASPAPGQVQEIATRLKDHDDWERDTKVAVQAARSEGTAAGVEQERARVETKAEN